MRLPRVLKRPEVFRLGRFQLLPDAVAHIPLPREHVVEHDIGFNNRLAPLTRARAGGERFNMQPTRIHASGRLRRCYERAVVQLFALTQLKETHRRIDDDKQSYD